MDRKWVRSDDIVWEDLDGQTLLVQPATGKRLVLNATASKVWQLCDGRCSLSELVNEFATIRNSSLNGLQRELAAFCEELAAMGLLIRGGTSSHAQLAAVDFNGVLKRSGLTPGLTVRPLHLSSSGARRRPSPRGNSGPG